jgi:hypothetical protein
MHRHNAMLNGAYGCRRQQWALHTRVSHTSAYKAAAIAETFTLSCSAIIIIFVDVPYRYCCSVVALLRKQGRRMLSHIICRLTDLDSPRSKFVGQILHLLVRQDARHDPRDFNRL